MSKYLALSDMDDTLLTTEKTITEETKAFLKEFVEKGNIFAICTGRPYSGVIHYYKELGFTNMPLVTDNGCAIHHIDGKTKYFEIPLDIFKKFLTDTKGMDKYMYCTTVTDTCYSHNQDLVPRWIIHDENENFRLVDGEPLQVIKDAPLICNYWVKKECIEEFTAIIEGYKDSLFYRNWGLNEDGSYSVEIHSITASKGLALRYLKEHYHIDEDKTMSFGDALNDQSMILEAYYGVAMINGIDELKQMTKYISYKNQNESGVVDFIKTNHLF